MPIFHQLLRISKKKISEQMKVSRRENGSGSIMVGYQPKIEKTVIINLIGNNGKTFRVFARSDHELYIEDLNNIPSMSYANCNIVAYAANVAYELVSQRRRC